MFLRILIYFVKCIFYQMITVLTNLTPFFEEILAKSISSLWHEFVIMYLKQWDVIIFSYHNILQLSHVNEWGSLA